jgi:hypothetical protein
MDDLYGALLAFLPHLRAAGREGDAMKVLEALTEGCNARELLDSLRNVLAELPEDVALGESLSAQRKTMLAQIDALWANL